MSGMFSIGSGGGGFSIVRLSQLSLVILSTISLLVVSSSHGAPLHRSRSRRFVASDVTALVSTFTLL